MLFQDNEYKLTEKRLGYGSQTKIVLAAAIDHDTKQFACKIINIKSLVKELAEKVKIQLAIIRHVQHVRYTCSNSHTMTGVKPILKESLLQALHFEGNQSQPTF
jgi:hypothetical protein